MTLLKFVSLAVAGAFLAIVVGMACGCVMVFADICRGRDR